MSTNYFKVMDAGGRTTRGHVFPFDASERSSQDEALAAATASRGTGGRVVAWERPRFGAFDGGVVGESPPSRSATLAERRDFLPVRGIG
jgi:hypothetical protein